MQRYLASGARMAQTMSFQEILRRLAIVNEAFADDQAGLRLSRPRRWVLDAKTAALVQIGALAAIGSPEVCLEWSASRALAAGATDEEITCVLLVVGPVIGLGRIVGATPGVAGALGYDIDTALESPSGH
jgi:4-carboxymuconolactone decarboxylase